MTFNANETGVETGQPIELYEFVIGADRTRMTSSENDVTLTTTLETFEAEAISRGRIVEEVGDPTSNKLEVRLPAAHDFVQQFRSIAPGQRATLTLFRLHRADLGGSEDRTQIFKGTLRNVSYTKDGRVAIIQVLSITSAYSRPTPRRTYQGLCNHMLYDSRCTISKDDPSFRHIGACTGVSGDTITVTGVAAFNALTDFFEAGFVEFNSDFRTVVAQSGDVLTLIAPFLTSPLGSNVIVRAGCKHRISTDCDSKFSNLDNFGGFPYVPKKNPFTSGLD